MDNSPSSEAVAPSAGGAAPSSGGVAASSGSSGGVEPSSGGVAASSGGVAASSGAMWERDPASRGLGIELVSAAAGEAVARMTVQPGMLNGHGTTHGGYVFLLADSAFALACNSHGPVTVAAAADIDFVRPSAVGDVLTAHARQRSRTGRSGIYDVTVTRDGEIIAEFRGRSRSLRPEQQQKPCPARRVPGAGDRPEATP